MDPARALDRLNDLVVRGKRVTPAELRRVSASLKASADRDGVPEAMTAYACIVHRGLLGPRKPRLAADYCQAAAKLGEPYAAYGLASAFMLGDGRRKNLRRAAELFEQAAEGEVPDAAFFGAYCRLRSAKTPDAHRSAMRQLRRLARQGDARAAEQVEFDAASRKGHVRSARQARRSSAPRQRPASKNEER